MYNNVLSTTGAAYNKVESLVVGVRQMRFYMRVQRMIDSTHLEKSVSPNFVKVRSVAIVNA